MTIRENIEYLFSETVTIKSPHFVASELDIHGVVDDMVHFANKDFVCVVHLTDIENVNLDTQEVTIKKSQASYEEKD